jgi:uncharacterized protein
MNARPSPTPLDDRDALARTLRDHLAGEPDLDFAYLFGSVAKGRPRSSSDVDVAVHFGGTSSAGERLDRALQLEGRLEHELGRTVQVTVLNDAPLELSFNVLAHGVHLATQDGKARRRFYVDTGRRYYDMGPARRLFGTRQRERIREGRFGG